MATGGPSKPVQTTVQPLAVLGGAVQPIVVLDSGSVDGGAAVEVYEVSAAELAERGLVQGEPLKVFVAPLRKLSRGPALPVYVVSGSLGGDVDVDPEEGMPIGFLLTVTYSSGHVAALGEGFEGGVPVDEIFVEGFEAGVI